MLLKKRSPLGSILQIEICWDPNPIVQFVASADLAERSVHHFPRHRHVRTSPSALERDPLDAVRAEQSQLADILLELLLIPAIVGVGRITIAQLMATNRL